MDIKTLFENTELTMADIAKQLGVPHKRVFNYVKANYTPAQRRARKAKTYRNSRVGSKNPAFGLRGEASRKYIGAVGDNKGYLMHLKPEWYTGRKGSKHVFLHHIVVCENMGLTEIPRGWCVHHVDFNPHNNEFCNLVILTIGDHSSLHSWLEGVTTISKESTLKWVEAHGTPFVRQDIVCSTR